MFIEEGTIFRRGNIVFKETNLIDTRMNHHPLLIPIEVGFNDDYIYFFTLSSQVQYYTQDKARYYLLKRQKNNGLKKTSIIDLKHVYKCPRTFPTPEGFLHPREVADVLSKFKAYPYTNVDDDCREFLSLIG